MRLKGVLTPAEQQLAKSKSARSSYLLKQVRNELLASGRPLLEAILKDILNVRVQSVHTDISTKTGERVIVISLQESLDFSTFKNGAEGKNGARGNGHGNGRFVKDPVSRG